MSRPERGLMTSRRPRLPLTFGGTGEVYVRLEEG
jgi:hypothetical protein